MKTITLSALSALQHGEASRHIRAKILNAAMVDALTEALSLIRAEGTSA